MGDVRTVATATLGGTAAALAVGILASLGAEEISLLAALDAAWRSPVYWILPVIGLGLLLLLQQQASARLRLRSPRAADIVGLVAVFVAIAVALEAASLVLGIEGFALFAAVGSGLIVWILLRFAPRLTAMDRADAWIVGLLFGGCVTWWVETTFELRHSIGFGPVDPNAVLLAACAGLTLGAGFALAGVVSDPEDDQRRVRAAICALVAVLLAWGNRFVVVPRLYLEAHLAMAAFEWVLWIGAFAWMRPALSRAWLTRLYGATVLVAVVAIITQSFALVRPFRIDYSTQMFALSVRWGDFDNDGFLPTWLGGADCDDGAPQVHPFAREAGGDENCTGTVGAANPPADAAIELPRSELMIVVTIDTLRPDYMQVYGAANETTPQLAAVDDWTRFDRAYTSGGITTLAVSSLLSGRLPLAQDLSPVYRTVDRQYLFPDERKNQRVNRVFHVPRDPGVRSVARRFTDAGRGSFAFVDDGASRVFQKGLGYEAGFGSFTYPNAPEGPGEEDWDRRTVTDAFLGALPQIPAGSFVWLHYYDPHNAGGPCRKFERMGGLGCYEDAIWDVDEQLGRVIRALQEAERWEDTFFAISSDHGEALGEHGLAHHGLDSYEEFVRIPLLARGPGLTAGAVSTEVSLIDISRTAVALAGLDASDMQGHDLRLTQRGVQRELPVVSQLMITAVDGRPYRQQTLVVDGDRRHMWDRITRRGWTFDISVDPTQSSPEFLDEAEIVGPLLDVIEGKANDLKTEVLPPNIDD